LQVPPKFAQIWIFLLENMPSGNRTLGLLRYITATLVPGNLNFFCVSWKLIHGSKAKLDVENL
jgi:hypothetical protein